MKKSQKQQLKAVVSGSLVCGFCADKRKRSPSASPMDFSLYSEF